MEILKVENLTKTYGSGENLVHAVDDVSFSVEKGEFVAIVGASGSGKSTLLHLIGGVDRPTSGKIFVDGNEKSYKFTVSEGKTLTAVYEDKPSGGGEITPPAKKDGLSGGAIAGIVIGSVAVAGIGGFAVLWFAVKKKTFADLGVALKKGFTAMGNGIKTACRAIGNFFKNLGAKIKALFTKKK